MIDYYKILGVNRNATKDDIKDAYRKLSKKFHPDLNEGDKFFEERFKEVQEAYEKLSDQQFKSSCDKMSDTQFSEGGTTINKETDDIINDVKQKETPFSKVLKKTIALTVAAILTFFTIANLNQFLRGKGKEESTFESGGSSAIADSLVTYQDNITESKKTSDTKPTEALVDSVAEFIDYSESNKNSNVTADSTQTTLEPLLNTTTPEGTILTFFDHLTNGHYALAWNITDNPTWADKGYVWFSSPSAFGSTSNVQVHSIITINEDNNAAACNVYYTTEDRVNGSKTYLQKINLIKTGHWWKIRSMQNIEPPK